jgi:hypothetical protein
MRTVILTTIAMLAFASAASGQVTCTTYGNVTTCSGITSAPQPPLVIEPQPHAFTQGIYRRRVCVGRPVARRASASSGRAVPGPVLRGATLVGVVQVASD